MANAKKRRIGIAATALALIFALGATAGTTLARYLSEESVNNQATVAKWGFTLTADASQMFGTMYDKSGTVTTKKDDAVVVSATSGKVIAPGTQGKFTLSINGRAEVNAILTIDVTDFDEIWLLYGVTFYGEKSDIAVTYFPITWQVNGKSITERQKLYQSTDATAASRNVVNKARLAAAILDAIESFGLEATLDEEDTSKITVKIPAGTDLHDFKVKIEWDWALHTEGTFQGDPNICDTYDTIFSSEWFADDMPFEPSFTSDRSIILWSGYKTMNLGLKARIEQTMESF